MKSGASLVIEPTEALTAIDVNTSKTELNGEKGEIFIELISKLHRRYAGSYGFGICLG